MAISDVLSDSFSRISEGVHDVLAGLPHEALTYRVDAEANTIAWLVWHLTRVQDDHVAGVAGTEQVWTAGGWAQRFALPFDASDIGYGQGPDDVGAVTSRGELLGGYFGAVHDASQRFLATLTDTDIGRVVDERWDPPVTLGVRLVSVIADDLQHVGQAAYIKGVAARL